MPNQSGTAYKLPPGWMIRRQGDEISVCAPDAKPGMKFVSANSKSLQDRLLKANMEFVVSVCNGGVKSAT